MTNHTHVTAQRKLPAGKPNYLSGATTMTSHALSKLVTSILRVCRSDNPSCVYDAVDAAEEGLRDTLDLITKWKKENDDGR